jgi:hypothetical protein
MIRPIWPWHAEYLCIPYVGRDPVGWKSYGARISPQARSLPMLDIALIAGFVLFCLYIAHERLTHRL